MTTTLFNFVSEFLSLSWLTGPIFDKELRVSSRRRRNYVLRFAYLALLTIFLVLFWLEAVPYRGASGAYLSSRMARAGQTIIMFIIWFQFCVTQLVAVIMLSNSISDEIYHRTLGLLMTTPISSFQVVMGKLFSKLLQLVLLLAISLPLLAVVRVFGGVPWDYVISSLCMTLTTVIFVGSLSLFFSIFSRRSYVVIIITFFTLGMLFAVLPLFTALFFHEFVSEKEFFTVLSYLNPYVLLSFNTEAMMSPRMGGWMPTFSWPVHCAIMLAGSAVILFLSVCWVRKVALRQATGQLGTSSRRRSKRKPASASADQQVRAAAPRRVRGPAVLWKELRAPVLGRRKITMLAAIIGGLTLLFITYGLCERERILDEEGIHMLYVSIFLGLGMLFTIVIPATCITSEKESRSWPLLLATTLSDWKIISGKFIGILRRCLPIWFVLFGHVIVFTFTGLIHPVAIIQMAILVSWIVVFLSGTGLYFSSRFRRTTTAVMMNFALAAVIWAIVPLLLVLIGQITHEHEFLEAYMDTNPFVHAVVIMEGTVNGGSLGHYYWLTFEMGAVESTTWMLVCMLGYMFFGFLFVWRAKCRLRRNIF
jgi:ABC-type transport system involved in multi-copper enzyme maturation permease subunit